MWLRPADGSPLAVNLAHAVSPTDALARVFALATPADVAGVWIRGAQAPVPAAPGPAPASVSVSAPVSGGGGMLAR